MINVKFSIPTYQADSSRRFYEQGQVQISSDVDNLSAEYPLIKAQLDELLKELNAENRLILDVEALEAKREKVQSELDTLRKNTNLAKKQLRRLENFLKRLGIDPIPHTHTLNISDDVALESANSDDSDNLVDAQVSPISEL
jgi:DNA integrity scanning protein DisA with diadenylate cyclase activity